MLKDMSCTGFLDGARALLILSLNNEAKLDGSYLKKW